MEYVGVPVAFPPSCGDDARKYLLSKIEERRREQASKEQVPAKVA